MIEPPRRRLPDTRESITRRVEHSGDLDIYVTVGFFSRMHARVPGEVFVKIAKEGSTLAGMVDMTAILMSTMLQYGIPWDRIARNLRDTNFEPVNVEGKSIAHAIVSAVDEIIELHYKGRDLE
ncbi:MAG: TSCPD domain-containing protein [Candidatus Thorarchaeota archaeon]|jgi:ribonucleoside-diphosphate reductase alpha chain